MAGQQRRAAAGVAATLALIGLLARLSDARTLQQRLKCDAPQTFPPLVPVRCLPALSASTPLF